VTRDDGKRFADQRLELGSRHRRARVTGFTGLRTPGFGRGAVVRVAPSDLK
jgi:hypothetical protein